MSRVENDANRAVHLADAITQHILANGATAAALRCGVMGGNGDNGLGGKVAADGTFTKWFCVGDVVGSAPVRPAGSE